MWLYKGMCGHMRRSVRVSKQDTYKLRRWSTQLLQKAEVSCMHMTDNCTTTSELLAQRST